MDSSWKVELYRSWDEVDSPGFVGQWHTWIEHAPDAHVFFHQSLLKAWTDIYRELEDISPLYCVAEREGITVFLPLVLWRRNYKNAFLHVVVPAGFSDYDYHDPIVSGEWTVEVMSDFWRTVERRIREDRSIRYDRIELQGFRYPCDRVGWVKEDDVCPFSDLTLYADYADYHAKLKKSLRQDLVRQKKRLSELGELRYKVFSGDDSPEALAVLPGFLDTHSRKWPHAFKPPGFHRAIIIGGLDSVVHFSALMIDGIPISWHLGFSYRKRFYYYMPAFLEEYGPYSPSKVHLSFLTEECFKSDRRIFDHLRGSETYKAGWADHIAEIYAYTKDASNLQARMRQAGFGAMQELKNIRRSIR